MEHLWMLGRIFPRLKGRNNLSLFFLFGLFGDVDFKSLHGTEYDIPEPGSARLSSLIPELDWNCFLLAFLLTLLYYIGFIEQLPCRTT
jgi:hypothetical protein